MWPFKKKTQPRSDKCQCGKNNFGYVPSFIKNWDPSYCMDCWKLYLSFLKETDLRVRSTGRQTLYSELRERIIKDLKKYFKDHPEKGLEI